MASFSHWWMLYRMGYLSNQMGIMRRYLDRSNDWQKHLFQSHKLILSEVKRRKPNSVAFLGSGWLLDIPLKELLDSSTEVCLIDIAHPKRVIHRFSKHPNIKLIDIDITGGAVKWAWDNGKDKHKLLDFNRLLQMGEEAVSIISKDYQFVVSINMLSQLHLLIEDFLISKNHMSDIERVQLAQTLQQAHINGLPKDRSLIISDTEAEFYNEDGFLSHTTPRIYTDLSELTLLEKWQWDFDSNFTFSPDYKVLHNVSAYLK